MKKRVETKLNTHLDSTLFQLLHKLSKNTRGNPQFIIWIWGTSPPKNRKAVPVPQDGSPLFHLLSKDGLKA